jgi:hypothetical protein
MKKMGTQQLKTTVTKKFSLTLEIYLAILCDQVLLYWARVEHDGKGVVDQMYFGPRVGELEASGPSLGEQFGLAIGLREESQPEVHWVKLGSNSEQTALGVDDQFGLGLSWEASKPKVSEVESFGPHSKHTELGFGKLLEPVVVSSEESEPELVH